MKRWGIMLLLVMLAYPGSLAVAHPHPRVEQPTNDTAGTDPLQAFREDLLEQINVVRIEHHLSPLFLSCALECVAQWHSEDMHAQGYFDHEGRDGRRPWNRLEDATSDRWRYVAENLAGGYRTAEGVVDIWMSSKGHRDNILSDRAVFAGIGIVDGGAGLELKRGYLVTMLYSATDPSLLEEYRERCDCATSAEGPGDES